LLAELYAALGISFACPRCGAPFDSPRVVHEHAHRRDDATHDEYEASEAPNWWPDDRSEQVDSLR